MKILHLLRDLFRQETLILVLLLAVAVGGLCFVAIADRVVDRDSQAFDEYVLRSLRRDSDLRVPIGPSWVAAAARDISALGGATVLVLVTVGAAGFLYCMGKRRAMSAARHAPAPDHTAWASIGRCGCWWARPWAGA